MGVASRPLEIERKFLVEGMPWRAAGSGVEILQGYLSRGETGVVRVRVSGSSAELTVKGRTHGISRSEFEYAIPVEDGRAMLELCSGEIIHKTRYTLEALGQRWEIDVFQGSNRGLVVAEIELESEAQVFERPDWLGEEVSSDPRYRNSSLSIDPYRRWR